MGTKNSPGKFDAYSHAEPAEPTFTLLARDIHAPFLLRAWADIREANGEAPAEVEEARACADAVVRWNKTSRARDALNAQQVFDLCKRGPLGSSLIGAPDVADADPFDRFEDWDDEKGEFRQPAMATLIGTPAPSTIATLPAP